MKKEIFFWIISITLLLAASFGFSQINNTIKISGDVIKNIEENNSSRVIIELKESNFFKNQEKIKQRVKENLNNKTRHDFKDRISAEISKQDLDNLRNDNKVKSIESVGKSSIFLHESTSLINSTLTNNIKISRINLTGKGETVCVLDTGVNFTHPDLQGKNKTCVIDCTSQNCPEDCSVNDFNGHGTHCAGIIGANGSVKGVAPGAGLIGVKVCQDNGGVVCYDDDIRAGIDWCIDNKDNYNISAISISLGSSNLYDGYCDNMNDPEDITGAINNAIGKNISVIASTGNDGNHTHIASPACIKNTTSVGDVYDEDVEGISWGTLCTDSTTHTDKIVCHSNRNNITDLFAPGALINSSWKQGYYETGGTSMATPHVAGAFALINQYKRLESNKVLNPLEIQSILKGTGKVIYDSDSGLNFSRIKTYSSILSIDKAPPEISLISPRDNYLNTSGNITFNCNTSDELQLKNLTFRLWNSTNDLVDNSTLIATNNSLEFLKTFNLSKGNYEWNCFSYDKKGNLEFSNSNYTLSLGDITISLLPRNNTYTNINNTNFNCNSSSNKELSNITFSLWNSSELIYNKTKNISGKTNTTTFDYTFINQGNYLWNCLVYDTARNETSSNNTITYDSILPNITLVSPQDNYSDTGSKTIEFRYNVSEDNIANCSLIINNKTNLTNSSINTSITNSFIETLSSGDYVWEINCIDLAGNSVNSSSRKITLEEDSPTTSSSSSGGGGSSYSEDEEKTEEKKVYKFSSTDLNSGKSQDLSSGEKINFTLNQKNHKLVLNKVIFTNEKSFVDISVYSSEHNFILNENESKKINIDDNNYYELLVRLESLNKNNASIFIKRINEEIPHKDLFNDASEINKTINQSEESKEKESEEKNIFKKHYSYIIILGLIVIIYFMIKKYKDKK